MNLHVMPSFLKPTTLLLTTTLMSILIQSPNSLPTTLLTHPISTHLRFDSLSLSAASSDFGGIVHSHPSAVFLPSSPSDIASLLRLSHFSPHPFTVSARGLGHSTRGQAQASAGIVINMPSLDSSITVSTDGMFVDVGGERMWIDVLRETLRYGLTPKTWTDYLYLTLGGTLSNGGISGQAFLHGPQISNVHELDIVTGKGEMVSCSESANPDLFFSVLGGLGQFGIITRARIALENAPKSVRWMRLMYTDFELFTKDQELLISIKAEGEGWRLNYVEGSLLMEHSLKSNWRSPFFSEKDLKRIKKLAYGNEGVIYCLEASFYYDYHHGRNFSRADKTQMDQDIEELLRKLSFVSGFAFKNDVTYMSFLNRVHDGELKLRAMGLWDVPHPWLNLLVSKSNIMDFYIGALKGIILKTSKSMGPILVYPTKRSKWDERMSTAIPNEEVFYSIGILLSSEMNDLEHLENQNAEILKFCDQQGLNYKQYLPHYTSMEDWKKHFGKKWGRFVEMKSRYDPKAILSPGQKIFAHPVDELCDLSDH
ncbi:cytokinin dehydrogenase 6 [Dendrobium catenatum]|uniref:cytokinin dehydrogenase n=1 Tax=Dendrobium catenatum TaxID=906689 RepID=A0A2I0X3A2_9ASPA|nr:cytokinin dehydrogenase 6 [Dendrobium catenatum]PKU82386.1 Cytokinin dehydrogenase 6 [Dendrobium catenatum]